MEQNVCKNKKCGKHLPVGYQHKYCENCRNRQVKKVKTVGKAVLNLAVAFGGVAVTVATKGKIKPKI